MQIPILPCQMGNPPPAPDCIGFELKALGNSLHMLEEALIEAWRAGHLGLTSYVGDWHVECNKTKHTYKLSRYLQGEIVRLVLEMAY